MAKYAHWTDGQHEALLNTLGEPNALALLRGEKEVEFRDCVPKWFDGNGRRIPRNLQARVCDPNPNFYLEKVEFNLGETLTRLAEYYPAGTQFLPEKEFVERILALIDRIKKDARTSNALNGHCFPVCLPQWEGGDYGLTFDNRDVMAMQASYHAAFSDRALHNDRKGELEKQVTIVDETHRQLCELLVKGAVLGILIYPLQGYSVHAQREQMKGLPDFVSLGGGFDVATANIAYPKVLLRDFHTPGQDMSALQWRSREYSPCVGAHGGGADFDCRTSLGRAGASYSGALFLRG